MKYEAEVDLRNENTSHALLVELVGRDKRVLDVGCASGYLGRVLRTRGCRVSGLEVDGTAAQAAEQVLDEVVTGDVAGMDLVGHFGKESFDVIVLGDVLEHLADPVAVLRRLRPLLAQSGSVVASIPNVAHGAVRLSLLSGRFDYRPLGLLDATHLRFFTRGSLHETFREAGLVPIDIRRTTAGVFETEIGLRREDFDEGVVDAVEGDPESTTYQFVVKAVPEDSPAAIQYPTPAPSVSGPTERCRVGIWTTVEPDNVHDALIMRVTAAEIARRLPGSAVRAFSSSRVVRPSPHDGGLPVEPLGPWSPERAASLAEQLDCVVVVGAIPDPAASEQDGGRHPTRFLVEGLGPQTAFPCPLLWSAVRLPEVSTEGADAGIGAPVYRAVLDVNSTSRSSMELDERTVAVPDPLLLVPRLLGHEALARRLEFVRMMGWYPPSGRAVVVEVDGTLLDHSEALARALATTTEGTDASIVLVQIRSDDAASAAIEALARATAVPAYRVPGDALADDRIAVIAGAAAFAPCSVSGVALGLAYERSMAYLDLAGEPWVSRLAGVTGSLDAVVTQADELADLLEGERFRPSPGVLSKLQSKLDAHFDRMAAIADGAAATRPRAHDARTLLPPSEYMAAMELAHRRMQERLDAERRAVAEHLGHLRHRHESETEGLRSERDSLLARLRAALNEAAGRDEREAELRRRLDGSVFELESLRNIRILRALRPARAVYARIRGQRL